MTRDETDQEYLDELNGSIDALIAGRAPGMQPRDKQEAHLLQLGRQLRAAGADAGPAPGFLDRLEGRLERQTRERQTGRRRLMGGLAAAVVTGLGGLGAGAAWQHGQDFQQREKPLVGGAGAWYRVAAAGEVAPGRAKYFTAGAVQGYLLNLDGTLQARSAICSHMGCLLTWQGGRQQFVCPCHGATFDQVGASDDGRGHPPLPGIRLKVEGADVLVWGTAAAPAITAEADRGTGEGAGT